MILLAIDPGASTGWAEFVYGEAGVYKGMPGLVAAGANAADRVCRPKPDVLVIEKPRIYPMRNMKGDPNDIVTLAVTMGRLLERHHCSRVHQPHPQQWKGQITKDAHHAKIFSALRPAEQEIAALAGKGLSKKAVSDMMDAIGLGQWAIRAGLVAA